MKIEELSIIEKYQQNSTFKTLRENLQERLNQKAEEVERINQEFKEARIEISVLLQKLEQVKADSSTISKPSDFELEKLQKENHDLKRIIEQNEQTIRRLMEQNIKCAQVIFIFYITYLQQIDELMFSGNSKSKSMTKIELKQKEPNLKEIQNTLTQFNSAQSRNSSSNVGKIMELLTK